ncbi:MAG: hypothetical protein Q8R06_18590 [Polaromonas sp.]|uniref:hypothetical protein n=1 Tax=Polaromonas sp. TaxID=1869339 RepID=UPI0027329853|nr:hypothetical protein [Polaromonas sp.]MDP3799121.1 hypothetical protein [Polaromonas sp.]
MSHAHHPHLFSREWIELHPTFVLIIKRIGVPLGIGVALAVAALFVTRLEEELNAPLIFDGATLEHAALSVLSASTGYLPDQFYREQKEASAAELPPQY